MLDSAIIITVQLMIFYNRKDIFYSIKIQGNLTYLLEISLDYGKMSFKCNYY